MSNHQKEVEKLLQYGQGTIMYLSEMENSDIKTAMLTHAMSLYALMQEHLVSIRVEKNLPDPVWPIMTPEDDYKTRVENMLGLEVDPHVGDKAFFFHETTGVLFLTFGGAGSIAEGEHLPGYDNSQEALDALLVSLVAYKDTLDNPTTIHWRVFPEIKLVSNTGMYYPRTRLVIT